MFARAACADVTPRDRPVSLAGHAARQAPASTVLDPIEISALMLESDGRRCLMLSFDLMLVGSELSQRIWSRLARHGIRRDEIVLVASHSHSAPATDQACHRLGAPDASFVEDATAAVDALVERVLHERATEVRIDIYRGALDHSINRRLWWPYPTIGRMHGYRRAGITVSPNPSGPRDETATVAILRQAQGGEPFALLWHYACHPTAMPDLAAISADFPGVARRGLRQHFGEVPCIFVQGFCGDVRPNMKASGRMAWRERLRRTIRVISSGPLFPAPSFSDWQAWSTDLAARLCRIAGGAPIRSLASEGLQIASSSIPLDRFFVGTTPDKALEVSVVRIGDGLEIVALSAEVTVQWQRILDAIVPPEPQRIRLYAGYSGPLFGYLPTAAQVLEGGYEVDGFQSLFGLSGHFDAARIEPAVSACVTQAFEELDGAGNAATATAIQAHHDQALGR
jgi:hypothetical protein